MNENQVSEIIEKLEHIQRLYHRLILVVGPSDSGKTTLLKKVAQKLDKSVINVNLELSQRMLDLTIKQRAMHVPLILNEIISKTEADIFLLDNTEILFDVSLKQDPLRLLQNISRNKTVISTWNGEVKKRYLTYASTEHSEYRRYPIESIIVINLQDNK